MIKAMLFSAAWCSPCNILKPIWLKLSADLGDRVEFEIVDIDADSKRAADAGVRAVPTIAILKDGEVLEEVVGLVPENKLREKLEEALNS